MQANHESWISRNIDRPTIAIMHDCVPVTMTGIGVMTMRMMSITIHNMPRVVAMGGMRPVCAIVSHMWSVLITSLLTLLRVSVIAVIVAVATLLGMMLIPALLGVLCMLVPLIIVTRHGKRRCQGKTCNQRG